MNSIISCIESLRMKLDRHRKGDLKEHPTRTIFVEPLLQVLGWDVRDPDEVELEYPTIDGKSVDYALKINRKPVLFIEAKALNDPLTDVKSITQVVGYAANAGVEWCILTNGVTYKVYHSTEKAEAPEKLLFESSLDPKETKGISIQQVAEQFSRFSRDAMEKGLLDEIGEQIFTTGKIRKALDKLFMEPPNILIRLVRSTIGDDTIKPTQVKKALNRLWAQTSEVEIPPTYESAVELRPPRRVIENVDTIVVPANKEGFEEAFLGENCWYPIRISQSMIGKIKYIAGYQTAPTSAITHYAEVSKIERYKDKFIVHFKDQAKEIGPLKLIPKPEGEVKAPQSPRYTTFDKLKNAKSLDEVF